VIATATAFQFITVMQVITYSNDDVWGPVDLEVDRLHPVLPIVVTVNLTRSAVLPGKSELQGVVRFGRLRMSRRERVGPDPRVWV